jgi:hypothetical protein
MKNPIASIEEPTHEEISRLARLFWEADGCRDGKDLEHWFQARAYLVADRKFKAGMLRELSDLSLLTVESHARRTASKKRTAEQPKPAKSTTVSASA